MKYHEYTTFIRIPDQKYPNPYIMNTKYYPAMYQMNYTVVSAPLPFFIKGEPGVFSMFMIEY